MLRVFSTFTGIGGFEVGIENALNSLAGRARDGEKTERQGLPSGSDKLHDRHISNARFVGYSEIDRYAIPVYERHFKGVKNYGDITKINANELPDFDCLVGGFPCQAFSIAGKRAGFEDTRGTLFFDLARILRAKRPRLFVFENVKGLLSHDNGRTFATIIATIAELGYDAEWQVVNSKNYGVPQNRERIIIIGHLRGTPPPEVFPLCGGNRAIIDPNTEVRDVTQTVTATYQKGGKGSHVLVDASYPNREPRIYSKDAPTVRDYGSGGSKMPMVVSGQPRYINGIRTVLYRLGNIVPTIRATQYKSGDNQPKIIDKADALSIDYKHPMSTTRRGRVKRDYTGALDTDVQSGVTDGASVRRLTPKECERLQGFPDDWTQLGLQGTRDIKLKMPDTDEMPSNMEYLVENSDTQRYKMCGNAVTTNVIQAVFERLLNEQ